MATQSSYDVVIAGGGPVGAVCALALANRGVSVLLCEADEEVSRSPRAATIHPATLEMLDAIGIADAVTAAGLVAREFQFWDRVTGKRVATFDHQVLADVTKFPFVVQCEQHKIVHIAAGALREMPHARVLSGTRIVGFDDDSSRVRVVLSDAAGQEEQVEAKYLIGCDGGRSFVRKALDIPFDGFTHPEKFVVLTTPFDFEEAFGLCYRNYFSDPDEWANVFKVSGDDGKGLWRVVFPTRVDETEEEALSQDVVQGRLRKFFPIGRPYEIAHRNIYRVHQRVANRFCKGRVFLAGDAAHVNNPIGGLGMNFGIHDANAIARLLGFVIREGANPQILDSYDEAQRPLNIEFVQSQTVNNKKRLEEKDPAVRARNFAELAETAADPDRARNMLMRTSLLESVRKSKSQLAA